MTDKKDKNMRRLLFIVTVINILLILLLMMVWQIAPMGGIGRFLPASGLIMIAGAVSLVSILWLNKTLKTLSGMYPAVISIAMLFLTEGLIREVANGASEAVMAYLIALDNDIVWVMRIILLYIGYYVLVAIVGLFVLVFVGGMLVLFTAVVSLAMPICIYRKALPDKVKARLHDMAFALAVVTMLGLVWFAAGAFINFRL